MKLENLLSKYFCDTYNIDINKEFKYDEIDANNLIVSDRLDLIAKIKYLEYKNNNYDMSFIKHVYEKQLEAITNGTCIEGGKEEKNGVEKYLEVFESLEQDILNNNFDSSKTVIPVGKNNAIMDGAHRTAICAYHNIPIPVVYIEELEAHNDAIFFEKNLLDEEIIDYLVTEYCKRKKDIYAVCIWPKADSIELREKAEKIILESAKIVRKKNVSLSEDGLRHFCIQIYNRHEWMGNAASHFIGATGKSSECYKENSSLLLYIIEGVELEQVLKIKNKVRGLFGMGNHSIHITDNEEETLQIANILLNKNSIHLLNYGRPDYYVKLNLLIEEFKNQIIKSGKSLDDFIIDSSGVLGLYGLREVNDLDYLAKESIDIESSNEIEDHSAYIKYHKKSLDSILYTPQNYLVYNEVKFLSLECAKNFKQNRGEEKDIDDIKLINSIEVSKFNIKVFMFKNKIKVKRKFRNFKSKLLLTIKKTILYKPLKNLKNVIKNIIKKGYKQKYGN